LFVPEVISRLHEFRPLKSDVTRVRVEDVLPAGGLAYELATRQWIDLFEDWEREIERLSAWTASVISDGSTGADATSVRRDNLRSTSSGTRTPTRAKRSRHDKLRAAALGGGAVLVLAFAAVALLLPWARMSPFPSSRKQSTPAAPISSPRDLTSQTAAPLATSPRAIIQAAAHGDPDAKNALGVKYAEGADGLPRDDAQAADWYKKAASQNYSKAEVNLGDMYLYGRGGLEKNTFEALSWYLKASQQQDPGAEFRLGAMLEQGLGTVKDLQKAIDDYRKAADRNYPDAENVLGVLYATGGDGLPRDDKQAVKWYAKAAEQGFKKAEKNLGDMYFQGLGVDAVDYKRAMEWYEKAADQGDDAAQYMLGYMYEKGLGATQNIETALNYYRRAAANGNADAQRALDRLSAILGATSK
jgi:uncharacterized protein